MRTAAENIGYLWIDEPEECVCVSDCIRTATEAYQRARKEFERLILCGIGAGGAYCVMLAGRFSPEGVWIEPFRDGSCDKFFQTLRSCAPNLFAVCARTDILLPDGVSARDRKRILRFTGQMRAAEKSVEVLKRGADNGNGLRNRAIHGRIIKTLA